MRKPSYYPIEGGEDLITPPLSIHPGRLIFSKNYECDTQGRPRRIDGFERFDGQPSPSEATYTAGATDEEDEIARRAAIEAARDLIGVVPGSGDIRGVLIYNEKRYAFRDSVDGTAGGMWVESTAGWIPVPLSKKLDFTSGGPEIAEGDIITGSVSGATATVKRVVVKSGTWAAGDAVGYLIFTDQVLSFEAENLLVSAVNLATVAGDSSTVTLLPGGRYEFENYNFFGQAETSRVYGCDGVNPAFEFDGTVFCPIYTNMATDTPSHIRCHKKHLFLFYPGGSMKHSGVGYPLKWDAVSGAAEIAISDYCVGAEVQAGGVLAAWGRNSTHFLYGNDPTDWVKGVVSRGQGGIEWTIQQMQEGVYLDDRGVTSLSAVQAYGDFASKTISQNISPHLKTVQSLAISSLKVRSKDQYRLFFSDGTGVNFTFSGGKLIGTTRLDYGMPVRCCCTGEIDGQEVLMFGSDDGYVYQLDKGQSFDGEEIEAIARLAFNHLGSSANNKRFFEAVIETDAHDGCSLYFVDDYDYGADGGMTTELTVPAAGGFFNIDNWNEFFWGSATVGSATAYLNGSGRNIGIFIGSLTAYEDPHTLQGITLHYEERGLYK